MRIQPVMEELPAITGDKALAVKQFRRFGICFRFSLRR